MTESGTSKQQMLPGKALDGLQIIFLIALYIGGFMFEFSSAMNTSLLTFRVAVVAVAAIGLLVVTIIKFKRKRQR